MKLTNKHKRAVKRQLDVEQGVRPPGSSVFVIKRSITENLNIKEYGNNNELYNSIRLWNR